MAILRWLRNGLLALAATGLASVGYVGQHFISHRASSPDTEHTVPFAAHGDYVFISTAENRGYYLLWAATTLVGVLGGWISVQSGIKAGRVGRPKLSVMALVATGFGLAIFLNVYWAFAS